jgi:hypothetical protein
MTSAYGHHLHSIPGVDDDDVRDLGSLRTDTSTHVEGSFLCFVSLEVAPLATGFRSARLHDKSKARNRVSHVSA